LLLTGINPPSVLARQTAAHRANPAARKRASATHKAPGPVVRISAALKPERLGGQTTILLGFRITEPGVRVPPPLRALSIRYPNNLGIALSGLGIETCTTSILELAGAAGCPPDSVMGRGSALAEVPFGPETIHELAPVTILRAEDEGGFITLLFDAQGEEPVQANIVLAAQLLPSRAPYGGRIAISVPLVPSLPEAPPVAVVELRATLGPLGLTYYETRGKRRIAYRPKGIFLPESCPRGGFPFAASFGFEGGVTRSAFTRVPCPHRHHRASRHRGRRR
jgi:hypothetical protein